MALLMPARMEESVLVVLAEDVFVQVRTKSLASYERANAIA